VQGLRRQQQLQPARLAGQPADRADLLQRLQVVLHRTHSGEAHRPREFGLRGRHAIAGDARGDQTEDAALGVGQVHAE
jgi:hypothetical protein